MMFWVVYEFNHKHGDYMLRGVHATEAKAGERYRKIADEEYRQQWKGHPSSGQLGVNRISLFNITQIVLQMHRWKWFGGGL